MSERALNGSLHVELRPSRLQRHLIMAVHGLAVLGIALSDLPQWAYWPGFAALVMSLSHQLRHPIPEIDGMPLNGLSVNGENAWSLQAGDSEYPARILVSSQVWVGAMFLRFAVDGRRVPLVLNPDSAGRDEIRRLRARLMTDPVSQSSF